MAKDAVIFTLGGVNQLRDVFKQIPEIIKAPLERLKQKTAFAVKNRAQALAPRAEGDLVNAIAAQKKGNTWIVGLLDVSLPSRGGNSAHQHPSVYGVWYEYGFKHRQIARHSFMRPAAESAELDWQVGIQDLAAEIERDLTGRGSSV